MSTNCNECGAHLNEGVSECDLCGSPVPGFVQKQPVGDDSEHVAVNEPVEVSDEQSGTTAASDSETDPAPVPGGHLFCNQCGSQNPTGSNFCSSCGSGLHESVAQPPPPGTETRTSAAGQATQKSGEIQSAEPEKSDSPASVGRQMGIIVGSGLLIVLALYMMSAMGGDSSSAPGAQRPVGIQQEGPLAEPFATQAETLQEQLAGLTGDARVQKLRELINLYISASRLDLAGTEAEQVAQLVNTERVWIDAGNLYYDWMDTRVQGQKGVWSTRSVNAYRKALEINPENLDVRTDMSIALMFHPQESAMASQENLKVLEMDSTHVQANFNRGIMLLQINRVDQAREQFQKVMDLVNDPNDLIYQRSQDAIASIAVEIGGS